MVFRAGFGDLALLARAAQAAVSDEGLTMRNIDRPCTASVTAATWPMPVVEHLGLNPRYIEGTMLGDSSFIAHLLPTMHALQAGQCNAVLICYGSVQRSAVFDRKEIVAARHMYEFGATRRHLAGVAVAARAWAQLTLEAPMGSPLLLDEVLGRAHGIRPLVRARLPLGHRRRRGHCSGTCRMYPRPAQTSGLCAWKCLCRLA